MAKTPEYPIVVIPELVKEKKQFTPLVFPSGQGDAPIGASEGLFETEQFNPKNRPDPNPNSNLYRNPRVDFSLNYFKDELILGGWWRGAILSLYYSPNQHFWLNEDGNEIVRPYPDGDKFESMAAQLYPLLKQHFN